MPYIASVAWSVTLKSNNDQVFGSSKHTGEKYIQCCDYHFHYELKCFAVFVYIYFCFSSFWNIVLASRKSPSSLFLFTLLPQVSVMGRCCPLVWYGGKQDTAWRGGRVWFHHGGPTVSAAGPTGWDVFGGGSWSGERPFLCWSVMWPVWSVPWCCTV